MRILVLNFEYPPLGGGASPVCGRISEELANREHEVTVLTMAYKDLKAEEATRGVRIFRIPVGRREPNMSYPLEHLRFLRKGRAFLKKHLRTVSYDVVHCHFILSTGVLAQWVYKNYKIPYIITAHGSDLPNYNPDRFQLIHFLTPRLIRSILKNSYDAGSSSAFLGTLMKPFLPEGRDPYIIPNGIYIPEDPIEQKEKIIISTGRMLKRKGFQNLIEAVRDIESGYELHICGDGPEMASCRKVAEGSKTKIVFHGWIDNTSEEYRRLLKKASIFSMVSEFENASLSILEGMAHSCAVITGNQSGTSEMVGEAGVLVQPHNTEDLRSVLLELTNNDEKTKALGMKSRARVLERYTWPNILDLYEDLLTRAQSGN